MGSTVRFNAQKCRVLALIIGAVMPILGCLVWEIGWSQFILAIGSAAIVLLFKLG